MGAVRVQAEDFDAAAEAQALVAGRGDVGALVTFVGLCRDEGGRLAALEIEHYPGMAVAEMARVVAAAEARWPLVAVAAAHRGEAFAAAEMLMDYLKTEAPFWKRARRVDGARADWIEARSTDDDRAARWGAADRE